MYRITVHYHVDGSRPGHPARSSEEPGQRVQREGRSTSTSARVVDELAGRGFAASRHACVLEATMCDPQVTTPAPSYDPGSHSKKSRRHGQPAPRCPIPHGGTKGWHAPAGRRTRE